MENIGRSLKKLTYVIIGNSIMAVGSGAFVIPSKLMTGGCTGLGIALNHFTGLPIAVIVAILNIGFFSAGAFVLGKTFALTAIISTFYFPVALAQVQGAVTAPLTADPMLASIMGGLLTGLGIGIVIRGGASTGGMDIPPLILRKKMGVPVSISIYVLDCAILLAQMIFSDLQTALYSLLLILTYTIVIDKVTTIGLNQMQAKIISEKYEEINKAVQEKLDRGTTLLFIEGGWRKEQTYAVLVVLSGRELVKLNELVMEYDPNAFMIINQVNEVKGRGFTLRKEHA